MSDDEQEPSLPWSEITAEQLLTRLLELIKDSASAADFTLTQVGESLGVPLQTYAPGRWGARARLTPDWSYALLATEQFALGPRVLLDFFDQQHATPSPMTEICQIDASSFITELSHAGFSNTVKYGEHDRLLGNYLTRGDLNVELSIRGESDTEVDHRCIQSVLVS
jgi:hypothetical protein